MQKIKQILTIIFPLRDFLYILQLEEYDTSRYIAQIKPRLFKRNFEKRDVLVWTTRIRMIVAAFAGIYFLILFVTSALQLIELFFLSVLLLPLSTPYLIALSSTIVAPIVGMQRKKTIAAASAYFKNKYPKTKVVAVTGSYGKTTTKYLVHAVLEYSFATAIIPKNINTTLGCAQYILKGKIPVNTEILVVEMGAYVEGDIREFCEMLAPDIAVITKLGDQHLERFGSFKKLVTTKNEIFKYAKKGALKVTSVEARNILKENGIAVDTVHTVTPEDGVRGNQAYARYVAQSLGVSDAFINDALLSFSFPERRNESYERNGVTMLDNSYNLSPETAQIMLREAYEYAKSIQKDLVVATGGISEQGIQSVEVNGVFAKAMNTYAKRVLLYPSVYASTIREGLQIPITDVMYGKDVVTSPEKYVDSSKEVLLLFAEQTDLSYL